MNIKQLFLKNFRNYDEATFSFDNRVNYILGKNAQGKTSLLEAIYLLVTGRSFRDRDLSNCISFDATFFYIEAIFEKQGIEQSITFYFSAKGRKISYNHTPLKSLTDLLGIIPGVLFCPKDINLITGSPSHRRLFINMLLSQTDPKYIEILSRYGQSIKQRNFLLKQKDLKGIECWEEQIAFYGAHLIESRSSTLIDLDKILIDTCNRLAFSEIFKMKYRSSIPITNGVIHSKIRDSFLKSLEINRKKEFLLQRTIFGPHRDDIELLINDKTLSLFASEGQKRSFLSLLKMTEKHFLQLTHSDIQPIFCLDDLDISLDSERGNKILSKFSYLGQVFITSCNPKKSETHPGKLIFIDSGRLIKSIN